MKLKNNIVIFAAYFIGNIYGLSLEEQFDEVNDVEYCHVICSKDYVSRNMDLKKTRCICPHKIDTDPTNLNNPKLVPLNHNLGTNIEQKEEKGKKVKRQTIEELIKKRNIVNRNPIKTVTLFSTKKPSPKFKTYKQIQKSDVKSRTSGLLSNDKQAPSLQELRERLKGLRERMSIKPRISSRGSFPEDEKSKKFMQQFNDKRDKIIKTLRSSVNKDATPLKEMVGSINHLQNRIDNIGSSIKEKIKERTEEKKTKDGIKIVGKENEAKATTETPKPTTGAIPEIVLGKTEPIASKTETVIQKISEPKVTRSDNIKAEAVPATLEKIMEKQKETVKKMKDKLNIIKNKS